MRRSKRTQHRTKRPQHRPKRTLEGQKGQNEAIQDKRAGKDSIEHSFIECVFTKMFTQNVLDWFNHVNECLISPTAEETLFGITASPATQQQIWKFNYTALFMRHYIYSSKLNSLPICIQDFISKLLIRYAFENLSYSDGLLRTPPSSKSIYSVSNCK